MGIQLYEGAHCGWGPRFFVLHPLFHAAIGALVSRQVGESAQQGLLATAGCVAADQGENIRFNLAVRRRAVRVSFRPGIARAPRQHGKAGSFKRGHLIFDAWYLAGLFRLVDHRVLSRFSIAKREK